MYIVRLYRINSNTVEMQELPVAIKTDEMAYKVTARVQEIYDVLYTTGAENAFVKVSLIKGETITGENAYA